MTQRIFRRHFNIRQNDSVPSHNTVLLWVRNFIETASAAKRKPPGREPSLTTPENIKGLHQAFVISRPQSARWNAIALRMSDHTVRRILHEDLNFHPYKMVMVQARNDQDTVNRKTLCEVPLNALDNDLNHVLMMDEANFHLCGNVNSQNCRYWATVNRCDIHQKPLHSEKVIVWCGVASFGVIGPYLFEDEAHRAVTVNSAHTLRCFAHLWNRSCRDLVLKPRPSGFSKTEQRLTLQGLQCESPTRCSELAWSHEEGILNGLQDRPISTFATYFPYLALEISLEISQEQGVQKETKDNCGLQTELQGWSGSNFSHHAATSNAKLPETLAGICWQGMPTHRHYIREVNIVIKMLWDKDIILAKNSCNKIVYISFYFNLKIARFFCQTL